MVETEKLTFSILVDKDLRVIKDYGILNEASPTVPHPTVVVIDRAGIVRFVHLDENYRLRPAPEVILEALRELPAAGEAPAGP